MTARLSVASAHKPIVFESAYDTGHAALAERRAAVEFGHRNGVVCREDGEKEQDLVLVEVDAVPRLPPAPPITQLGKCLGKCQVKRHRARLCTPAGKRTCGVTAKTDPLPEEPDQPCLDLDCCWEHPPSRCFAARCLLSRVLLGQTHQSGY